MSRGWGRRFWGGFEATGLGLLLAYTAGSHAGRRVVNGWAYRVTENIYGRALGLPADAFQSCFEHGLVIDPRKPLKVLRGSVGISTIIPAKGNRLVRIEVVSADWPESFEGAVNFVPEVVADERDINQWQRCDLGQKPAAVPPLRSGRKRCGVDRVMADAEPSRRGVSPC